MKKKHLWTVQHSLVRRPLQQRAADMARRQAAELARRQAAELARRQAAKAQTVANNDLFGGRNQPAFPKAAV